MFAYSSSQPQQDELLPLLALSVLATAGPFNAALECAASLQRCAAEDAAADLFESLTILRWKALRTPTAPRNPRPVTDADRGVL
ncbi:MAG: hypothetical protein QOK05_603 [Chloroflexota bacterium]|jgi:hypothetical protein|nr:hypothetical protein [Chloroflexota bacterium]